MGTNCAPLVADLFLFCYERDFMMSLPDDKQADIIDAFNTTSGYLDDILNIMPWLHLPYDEYTMPVRCQNHCFRAASAVRPCNFRTDLRASWPLRFCLTPHNDKFEKKQA